MPDDLLRQGFQREVRQGRLGAADPHKLFELDPLECPKCKTPMRIIGLIHDAVVVREILTHLGGRSQPEALERAPPVPLEAWPAHASLALTYDSVPDIA